MNDQSNWAAYYQALRGRPSRLLFRQVLARFEPAAATTLQAIDLGCGDGTETHELLARGWQVLAVDQEREAITLLQASLPPEHQQRLTTHVGSFEALTLPAADLIYAGLSLPFCRPHHFTQLWRSIVQALRPGGRFAGHLFGERDAWASYPKMTFLSRASLEQLLHGLEVELLHEIEEQRPTALGEPKHWHIFELIARCP